MAYYIYALLPMTIVCCESVQLIVLLLLLLCYTIAKRSNGLDGDL